MATICLDRDILSRMVLIHPRHFVVIDCPKYRGENDLQMEKKISKKWGSWVKDFAKRERGLSVAALSRNLGWSSRTLFRLLEHDAPPLQTQRSNLIALAHELTISLDTLCKSYQGHPIEPPVTLDDPTAPSMDEKDLELTIIHIAGMLTGEHLQRLTEAASRIRDQYFIEMRRSEKPLKIRPFPQSRIAAHEAPEPHINEYKPEDEPADPPTSEPPRRGRGRPRNT